MNHRIPLLFMLLLSAATSSGARAGDAQAGKQLVDEHCQSCHGNELYTSPGRKVDSLAALKKQVKRCELALGLTWFEDQIENATTHLNHSFYKFK